MVSILVRGLGLGLGFFHFLGREAVGLTIGKTRRKEEKQTKQSVTSVSHAVPFIASHLGYCLGFFAAGCRVQGHDIDWLHNFGQETGKRVWAGFLYTAVVVLSCSECQILRMLAR